MEQQQTNKKNIRDDLLQIMLYIQQSIKFIIIIRTKKNLIHFHSTIELLYSNFLTTKNIPRVSIIISCSTPQNFETQHFTKYQIAH